MSAFEAVVFFFFLTMSKTLDISVGIALMIQKIEADNLIVLNYKN